MTRGVTIGYRVVKCCGEQFACFVDDACADRDLVDGLRLCRLTDRDAHPFLICFTTLVHN